MKKELRLESLVGRRVRDARGEPVGKIREVEAEWHGHRCVVTTLHLGEGVALPIADVDLSDPEHPRLRRTARPIR